MTFTDLDAANAEIVRLNAETRITAGELRGHDCTICLEPLEGCHVIARTPCKHIYHTHCFKSCINRSRACPNCRRRIEYGTRVTVMQ